MFYLSFFSPLLWCFLEAFPFFFWSFCYFILYLFNVGIFLGAANICSFELLCSFSNFIFNSCCSFSLSWQTIKHYCCPTFFEVISFSPFNSDVISRFDFSLSTKICNPTILLPHIFEVTSFAHLNYDVIFNFDFLPFTKVCNLTFLRWQVLFLWVLM